MASFLLRSELLKIEMSDDVTRSNTLVDIDIGKGLEA
jgi:hypothetical protein